MANANTIKEALGKLDPANEDHWTSDGLPRLDVMKDLVGEAVTRQNVTVAAEGFTRSNPSLEKKEEKAADPAVQPAKEDGKPTETQNTQPEAPAEVSGATVEEISDATVDEDAAIEREMVEAEAELQKAKNRHAAATAAMDVVIARREAEDAERTPANDIQAFQRAQAAQREAIARQRKVIEDVMGKGKIL